MQFLACLVVVSALPGGVWPGRDTIERLRCGRVRFGGVRSGGRRPSARGRGEQPAPRPGRAGPQSEHASIKKRRRASAGSDKCMCAAPHAGAGRRFTDTCFQEVRTNLRSGCELATLRPEQNILEVELGILLNAQCVRPERQARHAQHATGDRVPQGEPTQKAGHYCENRSVVRAPFWQHADPALKTADNPARYINSGNWSSALMDPT